MVSYGLQSDYLFNYQGDGMKVITNNKPRENLTWRQLTSKEQAEFYYFDPSSIGNFFRYKGNVYDLDEAMKIDHSAIPSIWQGYYGETAFSGVLMRYTADNEQVIVGRYYS